MKPIYCAISVENLFELMPSDWVFDSKNNCWLKPITSLSDLPEEWKAEIREIAGKAFEAGEIAGDNSSVYAETKTEHLKGIL